jgi:hypothetical protein
MTRLVPATAGKRAFGLRRRAGTWPAPPVQPPRPRSQPTDPCESSRSLAPTGNAAWRSNIPISGVDGSVPVAADNTRRCRNDPVRSAASLDRMSAG